MLLVCSSLDFLIKNNLLTINMSIKNNRFAFVIPVYNHAATVAQVIKDAQVLGFPVLVIDDGSTDNTYDQIKEIAGIQILRHKQNLGKGAAIMTGFAAASAVADWAITVDADGQHYPEDTRKLIKAIPKKSRPIVVGARADMTGVHVPGQAVSAGSFRTSG